MCPHENYGCFGCRGPYSDANFEAYFKLLESKGIPKDENPDTSRAAAVSGEVAVEASTSDDTAAPTSTTDTSPTLGAGAANDETLPLPTTTPPDQAGQGLQAGSGVAAQNKGKKFSFSRSSNQRGN